MKKVFIFLFLFIITLVGCADEGNKTIDYLNEHECSIYIFSSNNDDCGLNKIYNITNVSEIDDNEPIIGIIVDVPNCLQLLTQETINGLYDLLEEEGKVVLMFYNAENYDFFRNTKLANEKDYYNNVDDVLCYDNINGYINHSGHGSNEISLYFCLSLYVDYVKGYYGML